MYCPACHVEYPTDWKVCPKDATSLLKSSHIGKYVVDGVLGVGGMGAVYRARNPDTGAAVAVKVMNPEVAVVGEARERFKREAAMVSRLDTAHVCKVFDFGIDTDGTMFLVMELMKGHTLRDEIAPLPETVHLARVQLIMNGALKGLAAAHRDGIVHRDLKPENVFVAETFDGEVPKLLDFGIARVVAPGEENLTRTGTVMGTASYMAAEQVSGAVSQMGPWTDTYAMGAILYEMLAGAPAFDAPSITEMLHRVVTGTIVPLASVRPGLPHGIYTLVERCLSVDPAKRPQNAEAMRVELLAAQLVAPSTPVPPPIKTRLDPPPLAATVGDDGRAAPVASAPIAAVAPAPSGASPQPRPDILATERLQDRVAGSPRRRVLLAILLGVVVVGSAVGVFIAMRKNSDTPPAPTPTAMATATATATATPRPTSNTPSPGVIADAAASAHPQMIAIPAATYSIGQAKITTADGLPITKVTLAAYWIDKSEVTREGLENALGDDVDADTRTKTKTDAPTAAARFVDFASAEAACKAMGKRMPTEAEWEVAALTTPQDPTKARLRRDGSERDLSRPTEDCSAAGLCDMLGGLLEWTSDEWPTQAGSKVVRGASFRTPPGDISVATIHQRQAIDAHSINEDVGFRCAAGPD